MEGAIEIKALRCRGRQGTTPDERAREQDYLVDIIVRTDIAEAVRADDIASALDISVLAKVVRDAVAERPRSLVERITCDVARSVRRAFRRERGARAGCSSPNADGLAPGARLGAVLRRDRERGAARAWCCF